MKLRKQWLRPPPIQLQLRVWFGARWTAWLPRGVGQGSACHLGGRGGVWEGRCPGLSALVPGGPRRKGLGIALAAGSVQWPRGPRGCCCRLASIRLGGTP